jgi:putative multiple sugar transport system substrate-binding protein
VFIQTRWCLSFFQKIFPKILLVLFIVTHDNNPIIIKNGGKTRMRKLFLVLLVITLTSAVFAGGSGEKGMIGLAMPETHVQRWIKDGNTLKAEAEKRGYTAEVQWANADQLVQNQHIDSFLTQGAQALVVGCINAGVAPAIANARRDGVHVIAYDRIIPNSADYDYYITFNNFKVGELQGQSIVEGLNLAQATTANPKLITLFAGSATDGNAFFFFDGAMSILNPYIERGVLRIIGPDVRNSSDRAAFQRIATENWLPAVAKARMENLLVGDASNVVLDAVLAPNDTLARAIIEALKADAKYRDKLPIISGQDAEFASMLSIRAGEQYSTVFKDTAKLAEAAILLADALIQGTTPRIPNSVIAENIGLGQIGDTGRKRVITYLLDPVLVTRRTNFNAPVRAGFYPADEAAQLR